MANCTNCDRNFPSKRALQQHLRDSPAHAPASGFDEALQRPKKDLPMRAFDCTTCHRHYGSEAALQQHLRYSPVHAPSFKCDCCVRSFGSEDALQQHIRYSPAHAPSFDCETCNRTFGSEEALEQHLRDSRVHQQDPNTPLDVFFRSFPTFNYDPSLPPAASFASLQEHEGWRRGEVASNDAWNRYQDALESELRMWYGAENDLTAWHALCRAIGIEPLPQTCEQCEEAARRTHVNIVDLIEWGRRRGNTEERVRTFRNVAELQAYTKRTAKVFRNTLDQEDGNVVLRHLLRKLFRGNL